VPAAVLVRPSSAKPLHAQGPSVRQPPTGAPLSLPVPPPPLLPVLLVRVCLLHAEQPSSSSILPFISVSLLLHGHVSSLFLHLLNCVEKHVRGQHDGLREINNWISTTSPWICPGCDSRECEKICD
jgi:hypothetical protein